MEKEYSKNKYLLKNTIVLSIGNFGSKIISFFLVPLYTNVLSTSEYGTLDIITIISTVIVPVITLNIQEAVLRYTMDKNAEKNKIFSVGIVTMLFMVILAFVSFPIIGRFNVISEYSFLLIAFMIFSGLSQMFICFIRGQERLLLYSIINIIQTFFIASLNIVFIKVFNYGIKGYLLAYIISYFVAIVVCFLKGNIINALKSFSYDVKLAKKMIKYSIILIPNSLMWWIMNSLDRVMITSMINLDANGIYAISYKIPSIIISLTTIFNQAWMFSAVKEKDSIDKEAYTNEICHFLFSIITTSSIFILTILKPLMRIYVGEDFYSAWFYTPPLIIGTVFLTMGTFISNEYTANKDSWGFLKSSTFGAIINILLNYGLIGQFKTMGAAIATCISYIAVCVFRIVDTRKYMKFKFFSLNNIIQMFLLLISSLIIYLDNKFVLPLIAGVLIVQICLTKKIWKGIFKTLINKIETISSVNKNNKNEE